MTFSFLILIPLVSSPCPLALRIPVQCWIEIVKIDTFVFLQTLEGMISTFLLFYIFLAVDLSYTVWKVLRYVPPIHNLLRDYFLNHEKMLNFIKYFVCLYWDNHMIFVLHLIGVRRRFYWLVHIEPFCHPWDKSHLIMGYNLSDVLLDLVS